MKTIIDFAGEMSKAFERGDRTNGEKFRKLKDGSPQWMTDVARAAHGEMMPDDVRYEMIEEAVDALSEYENESEARDSLEADIYTHKLTGWLHSRVDRTGYVDDALEEYGEDLGNIVQAIGLGQLQEKHEVFDLVVSALTGLVDAQEEDEDEDPELTEHLDKLDRETLVSLLEGVGIQSYDNESDETLREAVRANVLDGTISRADLP